MKSIPMILPLLVAFFGTHPAHADSTMPDRTVLDASTPALAISFLKLPDAEDPIAYSEKGLTRYEHELVKESFWDDDDHYCELTLFNYSMALNMDLNKLKNLRQSGYTDSQVIDGGGAFLKYIYGIRYDTALEISFDTPYGQGLISCRHYGSHPYQWTLGAVRKALGRKNFIIDRSAGGAKLGKNETPIESLLSSAIADASGFTNPARGIPNVDSTSSEVEADGMTKYVSDASWKTSAGDNTHGTVEAL